MKLEFSAGGIVFRRQQAEDNSHKFEVLMCQHSQNHGWGFPKGLIGDSIDGESKESTALREIKEETGAEGKILKALDPVTYWYNFEGEKVKKTVYYYLTEFTGGDITQHDYEMENVEWVEVSKVLEKLTYNADKEVFTQALPIIEAIVNSSS